MSSAEVIDALFDRTVDIAQSLPKSGPIQTSYEEKLALYSLYKQATEGDVKTRRPGMLDMLGRAKYDAWSNRRGMSAQDAKQLYVENMLRTMRKFSDRPEAMALIEELESFSGDVAQRVMSASLARADDSDSDSSSAGPSPRLLQQHRLPSMASNAMYNTAGEEEDERDSVSHLPRDSTSGQLSRTSLGQGLSSLRQRRDVVASSSAGLASAVGGAADVLKSGSRTPLSAVEGASAMAVRGGKARDEATSSRAMESDEEAEDDDELGHANAAATADPRRRSMASAPVYASTRPQQASSLYNQRGVISGPGSARGAFSPQQPSGWQQQRGAPLPASNLEGRLYGVPGQRYPGPPASDVVGGGTMGGGAGASMYSAVGPSARPTPFEQHYYHLYGAGDTSVGAGGRGMGVYGAPSSVGGRSAGQRGARPSEVDTALQSIQASLAALHERMNRVEGGGGRGRGRGGLGRGAISSGYRAFADALHDIAVLFGLRSDGRGGVAPSTYRGDGAESVGSRAGKRSTNGASSGGRNGQSRPTGWWAIVRLLIALAQLAVRVALDATSVVVVLSVLLFILNRATGRGDPLLILRLLRQWLGVRVPAPKAIERRIVKTAGRDV